MSTILNHNNISFYLDNSCKRWFSLPEKDVYNFIDTINSEEDIFFDLGACEGRFTIYAMKKNIKTYSFEPDCYNFNVLIKNINLNNIKNNNAFKIALSDKNNNINLLKGQPYPGLVDIIGVFNPNISKCSSNLLFKDISHKLIKC